MRAAAAALAAFEVAVRGRGAAFAWRQLVGVHGKAHRAAGIAPFEAGADEDLVELDGRDPASRLEGNPYREWLEMYAGADYQELAREAAAALDEQFARRGGEGRFSSLAGTFAAAARLEADFWQMGLEARS